VGQGFVEVADDRAVLLTDRFSTKDTIDVVAARMKLKELDEQLDKWEGAIGTPEHQALVFDEQWQAALLTLFGDPPPPMRRAVKYGGKHALLEQVESEHAPAGGDGSEEPAEPQSK
jgi:F-type H+-transporting ATPase subunit epsilon